MFNVLINSSNVASPNNNIYNYQFKTGSIEIPENSEAMITSFQIPYSWYNISARYNNNKFNLYFPSGTNTYSEYQVTVPDGFYRQSDFNLYMQQWQIDNRLFLIDASGNNIYFFTFLSNSTSYANQIILRLVPAEGALGTGNTKPSLTTPSPPTYPSVPRTCYIVFPTTGNFNKYAGFTTTTSYPPTPLSQITNYSVLSNITPLTTTVNSLVLRCSLVNNGTSNASDIIDAFSIGSSGISTFGSNLSFFNNIEKFVSISSGRFNSITVSIVDQNLNEIVILDNNLLISLLIRQKKF